MFNDITSGNAFSSPGALLGTVLKAANTATNAKSLSKDGVRQEGFGILKGAIGDVAGINVGGVANSVFPKSGGSGGLNSITQAVAGVSAVAAVANLVNSTSLSEARETLTNNPDALADLTKSTTFKKSYLQGGGDASVNAINEAWNIYCCFSC